jgi:hypothetical protein
MKELMKQQAGSTLDDRKVIDHEAEAARTHSQTREAADALRHFQKSSTPPRFIFTFAVETKIRFRVCHRYFTMRRLKPSPNTIFAWAPWWRPVDSAGARERWKQRKMSESQEVSGGFPFPFAWLSPWQASKDAAPFALPHRGYFNMESIVLSCGG